MSIKAMAYVSETYPKGGTSLLALLFIADFCNDDGWAWPSVQTLTAKCRLKDRKHMQDILAGLEQDGWIKRFPRAVNGHNMSNLICLIDYCRFHGIPIDPTAYANTIASDWDLDSLPVPQERLENSRGVQTPRGNKTPASRGVQTPNPRGDATPTPRGVQTPRSVSIDPPIEPPIDPKDSQGLSLQQQFFGHLCVIMLGHSRTDTNALTTAQRALLGRQAKRLIELGCKPEQLQDWYQRVWRTEWPGKNGSKPSVNQVTAGIVAYMENGQDKANKGVADGYSEYSQDWLKSVGQQYNPPSANGDSPAGWD